MKIFTYWETIGYSRRPGYLDLLKELWVKFLPQDTEIIEITPKNLYEYLDKDCFDFKKLFLIDDLVTLAVKGFHAAWRSDVIRLLLLEKYGGLWLDHDTIIYGNIIEELLKSGNNENASIDNEKVTILYTQQYCSMMFINALMFAKHPGNPFFKKSIVKAQKAITELVDNHNFYLSDKPYYVGWAYLAHNLWNSIAEDEALSGEEFVLKYFNPMMTKCEPEVNKKGETNPQLFEEFWFGNNVLIPSTALNRCDRNFIVLRNSWVPPELKALSAKEFLKRDNFLSKLILYLQKVDVDTMLPALRNEPGKARLAFYTQTFNAEKYIAKAIESVLNQTYTDFVFYIVDDASSDGTVEIIKQYAERDPRIITFYSTENRRMELYNEFLEKIIQSDAEYLCYLDNDDWYEPQFAARMIEAMDTHGVDMAICASDYIAESTMSVVGRRPEITTIVKRNDYAKAFRYIHVFLRTMWGRVYNLSIFRQNKIAFRTDMLIGTDTVFVLDYLRHANGLYIYGEIMHHYLIRPHSLSRVYTPQMSESDMTQHIYTSEWLKEMNSSTAANTLFLALVFLNAVRDSINVLLSSNVSIAEKTTSLCEVLTHPLTSEQFALLKSADDHDMKKTVEEMREWMWAIAQKMPLTFAEKIYAVFIVLCPEASEVINSGQFAVLLRENKDILTSLLRRDLIKLSSQLEYTAKASLSPDSPYACLLAMLINNHKIMENVQNRNELIRCPQIVSLVFRNEYKEAGKKIYKTICSTFDTKPELAFTLLDLCLYVSSLNEDADMFVFAKKALLKLYFNRQDREGFEQVAAEIDEMLPGDLETAEMRNTWDMMEENKDG